MFVIKFADYEQLAMASLREELYAELQQVSTQQGELPCLSL